MCEDLKQVSSVSCRNRPRDGQASSSFFYTSHSAASFTTDELLSYYDNILISSQFRIDYLFSVWLIVCFHLFYYAILVNNLAFLMIGLYFPGPHFVISITEHLFQPTFVKTSFT